MSILGAFDPLQVRSTVCLPCTLRPCALSVIAPGVGVGVGVTVGVGVGVGIGVGVGVGPPARLNEPIRNRHPMELVVGTYSLMYQKVVSSVGSMLIAV